MTTAMQKGYFCEPELVTLRQTPGQAAMRQHPCLPRWRRREAAAANSNSRSPARTKKRMLGRAVMVLQQPCPAYHRWLAAAVISNSRDPACQ